MSNPRHPVGGEPLRPKKKKKSRRWLLYTFLVLLGIGLGCAALVGNFVWKAYKTLPVFEDLDYSLTSVIYDSKDQTMYKLAGDENRTLIKDIKEIPPDVLQCFVDVEDRRFYEHRGVDLYAGARAVWVNIKYKLGMPGGQVEGASTITMQLARNAFLTLDQNWTRKVQEMMIALQLEKRFTKDEILLRYLNQISFGNQTAGLEEAAHTYFSKSAKDLTLSEAAMLAGMLKGPSLYDPFVNMEGVMNRRTIALDLMVEYTHLDAAEAERLKQITPELNPPEITPNSVTFNGDWYTDYVYDILTDPTLSQKYGTPLFKGADLLTKGLKIYTAFDPDAQKIIEEKVLKILPEETVKYGGKNAAVPQAAVVVMNHQSGRILAMMGGTEHKNMLGLNRATASYRDPGSSIKPIVAYFPAIDSLGWGPGTVVDDSPLMLNNARDNVWPTNYEFKYTGLVPLRYALEQSINAAAVRTLQAVTPRKAIEGYAHKMGLTTIKTAAMSQGGANDENLALTLGGLTFGVTPLDMTRAYGVFGAMGYRVDPVVITRIENRHGEVIFQASPKTEPLFPKASTWLMVDMMRGTIRQGTAAHEMKNFNGWPAAGKTGTTEEWHDAWFVGVTPELSMAVWTGYDNDKGRKPLPGAGTGYSWTGAGPPTRIWKEIMQELVKGNPTKNAELWNRPPGIVGVEICKTSGLLPSPLCPKGEIYTELFRAGYEPKQIDNVWTMAKVVRQPWLIPGQKKIQERYFLWEEGCPGVAEELNMLKRPTKYEKHPTKPWDFARYWPADWWKEVPTEKCQKTLPEDPNAPKPPVTDPNQPPGTTPPGTTPPGTTPPGTTPPGGN